MIYWLTASAGSAAYVGYAQASWGPPAQSSGVPTGAIMFAHDVGIRRLAEQTNNITTWTDIPIGEDISPLSKSSCSPTTSAPSFAICDKPQPVSLHQIA